MVVSHLIISTFKFQPSKYTRETSQVLLVGVPASSRDTPGPEVIKLFSSSAQLSMKFQILINVEMVEISGKFRISTQQLVIYPANKC